MSEVAKAREMIQEAEADAAGGTGHDDWTKIYGEAASILDHHGCEQEGTCARWMACLMGFSTILPANRVEARKGWFGSKCVLQDGTKVPDPSAVTSEMLDFYNSQRANVSNPVIKSRCCDIIWERRNDHTAARHAVEEHLRCVGIFEGYGRWSAVEAHLSRAAELARRLNDRALVQRVKERWIAVMASLSDLSVSGALSFIMDIEAVFDDSLIKDDRARLAKECRRVAAALARENDFGAARDWLNKAADLYRKGGLPDAAHKCIVAAARATQRQGEFWLSAGGGQPAVSCLQRARVEYHQLGAGYAGAEDRVALLLRNAHPVALGEMRGMGVRIQIPTDYINSLSELPLEQGLRAVFGDASTVPRVEELRGRAAEWDSQIPLWGRIHREVLDRRNTVARSDDANQHEHLLFEMMEYEWQVRSRMLASAAWAVFSAHPLSDQDFVPFLSRPGIAPDSVTLIRQGLQRYLNGDFVGALHILIPRFEACIRHVLMLLGRPTSRLKRDGSGMSEEKSLDNILNDTTMRKALGDDLRYFYRFVFSDQRGWNLRNLISHGLENESICTEPFTTVVVYALLSLGWHDFTEKMSATTEP